jgi:hypothetical protein
MSISSPAISQRRVEAFVAARQVLIEQAVGLMHGSTGTDVQLIAACTNPQTEPRHTGHACQRCDVVRRAACLGEGGKLH